MYLSVGRSGHSEEDDENKTNPNHYFRQIKIILHFASLLPSPHRQTLRAFVEYSSQHSHTRLALRHNNTNIHLCLNRFSSLCWVSLPRRTIDRVIYYYSCCYSSRRYDCYYMNSIIFTPSSVSFYLYMYICHTYTLYTVNSTHIYLYLCKYECTLVDKTTKLHWKIKFNY